MISSTVGKQVGTNLFHSFSQFDLISSESATFTGPSNIQNILARVTGGSASSIDGTVQSAIAGANLFLLNPAGVIFGAHAHIDVSGSFAVSTANYLKLADGGRFNTSLGGQDVLTSAPVTAFGFLNAVPAPVSITESTLNVSPAKSFSAVAGDISIDHGTITGEGSRVNLLSVKSAGEAQLDATNIDGTIDVTQFTAFGDINLTNAAQIDTSGLAGGPVIVRGGSLNLDDSFVTSETSGAFSGGTIDIVVKEGLTIGNGSYISTNTIGTGNSGNVFVNARTIVIDGKGDPDLFTTGIQAGSTNAVGNAGNIALVADDVQVRNSSLISTNATGGIGNGGNIAIDTQSLLVAENSLVDASSLGDGHGGDVTVIAGSIILDTGRIATDATGIGGAGDITLTANSLLVVGGIVFASTFGSGDGGNIVVTVGSVSIEKGNLFADTEGVGNAGNITLTANSLDIEGSGMIETDTLGTGMGGEITVTANQITIKVSGQNNQPSGISSGTFFEGAGGDVHVIANSIFIDGGNMPIIFFSNGITAQAGFNSGDAGDVTVQTGILTITGGGQISSSTFGRGNGGRVSVFADSILIDGEVAGITAQAELGSSGNAGDVIVQTGDLTITDGSGISSSTFGQGNGGSVTVIANSLLIDGATGGSITGIFAEAHGSGHAGDVTVQTSDLTITGGGEVSSNTFGQGDGGNVTVTANSLLIDGVGAAAGTTGIFAQAATGSAGAGGEVVINVGNLMMENGGNISAKSFTSAIAGSVLLTLGTLSMDSDSSISSANTGTGSAGSVFISTTGSMELSGGSSISTSSSFGNAGSIELTSNGIIRLREGSSITASAGANGGNIHLSTPDLVYLTDSSITATAGSNGGSGTGGNITIDDPQFIILKDSLISANATIGQGGDINLISDFLFNSNSPITATGATNGIVNITAPELDLGATLITLPSSLLSAETQLRERCTAQLRGDFSSFITLGRGGTEPAPDELRPAF
jgi:filamentous hemagglutinin family protein